MQKIKKFIIHNSVFLIILLLLVFPVFSSAAGLVPCDTGETCNFSALMTLIDKVLDFIFQFMVIPIAAIMFAYAGFELITSGGSTEKRGIAKKVFINTAFGLIIAMAAWLIVKLILTVTGFTGPGLLNK